jgi:GT2 family glycosyltransferase
MSSHSQDPAIESPREPRANKPRVTVAVPSYNGRHLLEVLLPSLQRQRFCGFEVIVVDDGSTDDTVAWLRNDWSEVQVLPLAENVGVTTSMNLCISAGDTEFVALLNNDIELDDAFLEEMVTALDAHPDAAVVTAKLVDFYNRDVIDGAGDIYFWSGETARRGQGEHDVGQYDEPRSIFGACGGAAMYRREAVERVGLFDEDFFAIREDTDWSFRAQLLGYTCWYVPGAVAYHMGSATLGRDPSDFSLYQNWRNEIWVVLKNYPRSALLRHGHEFVISQLHNLVWTIQKRRAAVFRRVWIDVLRSVPQVLRKRRAVQRTRRVGLRELEQVVGSMPDHG